MKHNYKLSAITLIFLIVTNFSNSYSQLSGNYTVGSGGSYPTITAAAADLVLNGVTGPVVFNIITGNYNEVVTIDSVAGTSAINTVTFKSQSGNAVDVNIFTSSASVFTMKIRNADFLIFRHVEFSHTSITVPGKKMVLLEGNCNGVQFIGNRFVAFGFDAGLSSQNASLNDLVISENYFQSERGIEMYEPSLRSAGTKILSNEFVCINGVSLYRHDGLLIEKNIIKVNTASFAGNWGVYLADCNGVLRILKNKISNYVSSVNATDGIKIDPYTGNDGLIANNFISIETGTGMYIGDCNNLKIYYNSVYCSATKSGNITIVLSPTVTLRNNIYVQLFNSGDETLNLFVSGSGINSDYNDYYFLSEHMLRYNLLGYIDNLSQFQSLTGQDLNSVERQVTFVSPPDLHLAGSSIGDEDLAGIPLAEVTDDIDGTPRSAVHPYMGADEADVPLPVELASFTSVVNERNVTLDWVTVSEQNNSGFEIERSNIKGQTSGEWVKIGFVNGHGTANNSNSYSFSDRNLISGKYNYRLKQIDFNGNFEYFNLSNQVVIGIPEKFSLSQNYPNPFNPNTLINFEIPSNVNGDVKLTVFNSLGKEVATLVNEKLGGGYHSAKFDGSVFSSGIYFYTLQSENFRETKRMILIK